MGFTFELIYLDASSSNFLKISDVSNFFLGGIVPNGFSKRLQRCDDDLGLHF